MHGTKHGSKSYWKKRKRKCRAQNTTKRSFELISPPHRARTRVHQMSALRIYLVCSVFVNSNVYQNDTCQPMSVRPSVRYTLVFIETGKDIIKRLLAVIAPTF